MKEYIFLQKLPNTICGIQLNEFNTQYASLHKKIRSINQYADINRYINLFYESLENNNREIKPIRSTSSTGEELSKLELLINKEFEGFLLKAEPYFEEKINQERLTDNMADELSKPFVNLFDDCDADEEKSNLKILKSYKEIHDKIDECISSDDYTERDVGYKARSKVDDCFYNKFINNLLDKFKEKYEIYVADDKRGSHLVLNDNLSEGRLKREYDETLCSPKKSFYKSHADGDINGSSVSCTKCITSMIKIVSKKENKVKLKNN